MARGKQAKGPPGPGDLFTASEVARFCQVDLKTIHNWADRGEIQHFRTPGRHLRFRRADVLDFLRKYGYPIPDVLKTGRPRVVVLHADDAKRARLVKTLEGGFDVEDSCDALASLVRIGAEAPDVLVAEEHVDGVDAARMVACLKSNESTQHVRVVVCGADESRRASALDAGASAFVTDDDSEKLVETLDALLGLTR